MLGPNIFNLKMHKIMAQRISELENVKGDLLKSVLMKSMK